MKLTFTHIQNLVQFSPSPYSQTEDIFIWPDVLCMAKTEDIFIWLDKLSVPKKEDSFICPDVLCVAKTEDSSIFSEVLCVVKTEDTFISSHVLFVAKTEDSSIFSEVLCVVKTEDTFISSHVLFVAKTEDSSICPDVLCVALTVQIDLPFSLRSAPNISRVRLFFLSMSCFLFLLSLRIFVTRSLSACQSVSRCEWPVLSVCLSVYPYNLLVPKFYSAKGYSKFNLSTYPPTHPYIYPSICVANYLCLFVYLSIHLYTYIFIYL